MEPGEMFLNCRWSWPSSLLPQRGPGIKACRWAGSQRISNNNACGTTFAFNIAAGGSSLLT
jgi:hypothetical protein